MATGGARLFARPLVAEERDGLAAALARVGLPAEDIHDPGARFWRFERDDVPIGFGGLEIHGEDALLRSILTVPPMRHRGYGHAIVESLEIEARSHGCRALYLLTTSAASFFQELGYVACERNNIPPAIRDCRMFALYCPSSAAVMVKRL